MINPRYVCVENAEKELMRGAHRGVIWPGATLAVASVRFSGDCRIRGDCADARNFSSLSRPHARLFPRFPRVPGPEPSFHASDHSPIRPHGWTACIRRRAGRLVVVVADYCLVAYWRGHLVGQELRASLYRPACRDRLPIAGLPASRERAGG